MRTEIEELKRDIKKLRKTLRDSGVNRSTLFNVSYQKQSQRNKMALELSNKEDQLKELERLDMKGPQSEIKTVKIKIKRTGKGVVKITYPYASYKPTSYERQLIFKEIRKEREKYDPFKINKEVNKMNPELRKAQQLIMAEEVNAAEDLRMRKTSKQTIQNRIRKWIQGLPISVEAKKCYHFEYVGEERNNYRFRFCIDGDLVEILYYSNYKDNIYKREKEKFNKIFKSTNWNYDFEGPTILIIFMED